MNRFVLGILMFIFFSCDKDAGQPIARNPDPPATNRPPVAIGGPDLTITLPDTSFVVLDGSGSYDPDGSKLTLTWTPISRPLLNSFFYSDHSPGKAIAGFATKGKYLFQLTAQDDQYSRWDTVEVTVEWASDCNPIREIVSAEIATLGSSPSILPTGLSYANGDNKLVLAGGILGEPYWAGDPATYSVFVHIYDIKANSWSRTEMFKAKGEMACVIVGNKLYMGGGVTNDGKVTDDVEIHDLVSRVSTRAKLSAPRSNLSVAAAGSRILFAGGGNNDGNTLDVVDIYDISTDSWSTAKLSEPRKNVSAIVQGDKIFFVGGELSHGIGYSNVVDIYDATTGSWQVRRIGREGSHFQLALMGNQMVVSGGITSSNRGLSPRVEFVDLSNWTSVKDCNLSASYLDYSIWGESLNTAVVGDKVYFANNESISVYNSTSKAWKYAKMDSYNGLLFTYQGQLYSFRYERASMRYQVIRIVM